MRRALIGQMHRGRPQNIRTRRGLSWLGFQSFLFLFELGPSVDQGRQVTRGHRAFAFGCAPCGSLEPLEGLIGHGLKLNLALGSRLAHPVALIREG